ncbi:Dabb family protein [Chondromyces apiculatus]|uniref:Stress-response A/B barrel domain-containing protein n=1 Tax=Chondromyces apiculatus DSM 436 TaxID=1192034 RepID=A0A017TIU0_9BACT|nr:Dabb family protein [Chondromyces apiculatus]EYF08817.1 Hypothetical protein CAP_2678 [Chondromyces apiculatus DSM 436]
MIKHCVLFKLRPGTPKTTVDTCLRELGGLVGQIPGLLDFVGGPDASTESRSRGYTHGFVMTFDSAASRDAYLPHPDHKRVAANLIQIVDGGPEGTLVMDFES